MKISNMIDFIGKIGGGKLSVNQERCVLVRNRNADCLRCASVCVSGCISTQENELIVDPFLCIGCGTCATICPTAALEPKSPTDKELLLFCDKAAANNDGTVVIMCDKMAEKAGSLVDFSKAVVVPCIGRVEESLLVTLASHDVSSVLLIDKLCVGCEHEHGHAAEEQVITTAKQLLDTWHNSMDLHFAQKLPHSLRKNQDEFFDAEKRAFFSDVKEQTKNTAKEVAVFGVNEALDANEEKKGPVYIHVNEQGVLPHFVPDRRTQLINSLSKLGQPDDIMFDTRLWGNVIIDTQKCKSCYMCAVFCPTGALVKLIEEDGKAKNIGHIPSKCVKCRTCENICTAHAISISQEVFAIDILSGMTETFEMEKEGSAQKRMLMSQQVL